MQFHAEIFAHRKHHVRSEMDRNEITHDRKALRAVLIKI